MEAEAPDSGVDLITEEWLGKVGFKWHEVVRSPTKHWLLWLGRALGAERMFASTDDLGIELCSSFRKEEDTWFCWLRSDCGGLYSRFLHIRYLRTQQELTTLITALTGQQWDPENNRFGMMLTPRERAHRREEDERLDRQIMLARPWHNSEKDPTHGGALPHHMQTFEEKGEGA